MPMEASSTSRSAAPAICLLFLGAGFVDEVGSGQGSNAALVTMCLDLVVDGVAASKLLRTRGSKECVEVHGDFSVLAPRLREKVRKRWVIRRGYASKPRGTRATWGTAPTHLLRRRAHHGDRFSTFLESMGLAALTHGLS